ncbi:unnamed protein product [Phytophthora fragariaefolia]|uniref:Unnamed protein product n=1 Tax=Phytophthora fragariaefolia TaxID=1490495 RepID=A0A9W7D9F4_9STRA|nr:unnamed protein product [Phytophthora fragariaefolia]
MSSSAGGGRSAPSRTVGDYSSRPSFKPFGGFGGGEILSNMIRTLGPDSTINNSLDDPASCPLCASQWGWRRREDATGLVYHTSLIVWRLLNASRSPSLLR